MESSIMKSLVKAHGYGKRYWCQSCKKHYKFVYRYEFEINGIRDVVWVCRPCDKSFHVIYKFV